MCLPWEGKKSNLVLSGDKVTNYELFVSKVVKIGLLSLSIGKGSINS